MASAAASMAETGGDVLPLYSFPCLEIIRDKRTRQFGSYQGSVDEKELSESADGSSDESIEEECYGEECYRPSKIRMLGLSKNSSVNQDLCLKCSEEEESSDSSIEENGSDAPTPVSFPRTEDESEQPSKFDDAVLEAWERASQQGLMKYDVTECPTKVAKGKYSFILQLNLGRAAKKRQTEYRIDQVVQKFDETKFNFTKIKKEERLMQFDPTSDDQCSYVAGGEPLRSSSNVVLANISPIEYGHILLIPKMLEKIPQLVSPSTLYVALQMALASRNRFFRIGFNSLGAYGSVNHLHFQGYYMYHAFPIERSPTRVLVEKSAKVSQVLDYPVRAFCVEVNDSVRDLAKALGRVCEYLQSIGQPYNLLICDSGARVFLIPNAFSQRAAEGSIPKRCWTPASTLLRLNCQVILS